MRYHEPFQVFPRRMSSGLTVWYFRAYDASRLGHRTTARSTGCTTKGAARDYCRGLERDGKLLAPDSPMPEALPTFKVYATGFWAWDGEYVQTRLRFGDPAKPPLSRRYVHDNETILTQHLMPEYGRLHLDTLTPQRIEAWSLRLRDGGLSGKRVNAIVTCLRIILTEAHRAGKLPWDPKGKRAIRPLGVAAAKRGVLTLAEVVELFKPENADPVWENHTLYRVINLTAAATGAREGELLAIRSADVHEHHIHIAASWNPHYGLGPTKTKQERDLPLPPRVRKDLEPLRALNAPGFVFSQNGGDRPAAPNMVLRSLGLALERIGVSREEQIARGIVFHSWRHWLNSALRARGVPDPLVREVTGHATAAMTERYQHFMPEHFEPVAAVQREVFG